MKSIKHRSVKHLSKKGKRKKKVKLGYAKIINIDI